MTALRVLFGLGYAVMGTFCAAGLLSQPGPDRHGTIAIASFITAISFEGLVLILFILVFPRFRPGAALGTAPSGLPAVVFRRLPVMMLVSTLFCAFLVGWSGWLASVLHENGHEVWASLSVAFALLMLWPLAVLVSGRIEPGGLWLTPIGLEYRNERSAGPCRGRTCAAWTGPTSCRSGCCPTPSAGAARPSSRWGWNSSQLRDWRCGGRRGGSGTGSTPCRSGRSASTASTWPGVVR
jgi:hypothetical protein